MIRMRGPWATLLAGSPSEEHSVTWSPYHFTQAPECGPGSKKYMLVRLIGHRVTVLMAANGRWPFLGPPFCGLGSLSAFRHPGGLRASGMHFWVFSSAAGPLRRIRGASAVSIFFFWFFLRSAPARRQGLKATSVIHSIRTNRLRDYSSCARPQTLPIGCGASSALILRPAPHPRHSDQDLPNSPAPGHPPPENPARKVVAPGPAVRCHSSSQQPVQRPSCDRFRPKQACPA